MSPIRLERRWRVAYTLATAVGVLMVVQSVTGMLFFRLYHDPPFALAAWRVNDPVTFFAAVPLLFGSLALARRGSLPGLLVLLGTMQYALYNYAFYLFGATLNGHFLLYVALLIAAALALLAGLSALEAPAVCDAFSPRAPARLVAGYMAIWAAGLGVAWIGQALAFAFTGQTPAIGAEPFRLIAALDLTLVVTPVALGAVWLWASRAWGFVLAVVMNVKGALYAALLSFGSLAGGAISEGGGDGLLGLWVFFTLGSLASLVLLLTRLRPATH